MDTTGGPAYPTLRKVTAAPDRSSILEGTEGMTLLDWHAGQALIGILAGGSHIDCTERETALGAYNQALAMLEIKKEIEKIMK